MSISANTLGKEAKDCLKMTKSSLSFNVFNIRSKKQKKYFFFKLRVLEILFKHGFNNKQGLSQFFKDDEIGVIKKYTNIFVLTKCQENTKHPVTIQILLASI